MTKLSELTTATALTADDYLVLVDDPAGTPTTKKITAANAFGENLTELAAISPSQGDIIYHNGTSWVRLAAGTSGYFLKTLGSGANPAWDAASGSVDEAQVALIAQVFGG
jgi:hypothetical protein